MRGVDRLPGSWAPGGAKYEEVPEVVNMSGMGKYDVREDRHDFRKG